MSVDDAKPGECHYPMKDPVPGPITDKTTIGTLLGVIAVCAAPSARFTFTELMTELRGLLDDCQTIADKDVSACLPGEFFAKRGDVYIPATTPMDGR